MNHCAGRNVLQRQSVANKNVSLANVNELAEKIVGKKVPVFHFKIPSDSAVA